MICQLVSLYNSLQLNMILKLSMHLVSVVHQQFQTLKFCTKCYSAQCTLISTVSLDCTYAVYWYFSLS
jgi:hypothetical protein